MQSKGHTEDEWLEFEWLDHVNFRIIISAEAIKTSLAFHSDEVKDDTTKHACLGSLVNGETFAHNSCLTGAMQLFPQCSQIML